MLGGARLTNEAAYAWAKLAKAVIGTDHTDAQLGDGLPADVISSLPAATIDDVCRPGATVLYLGPDRHRTPSGERETATPHTCPLRWRVDGPSMEEMFKPGTSRSGVVIYVDQPCGRSGQDLDPAERERLRAPGYITAAAARPRNDLNRLVPSRACVSSSSMRGFVGTGTLCAMPGRAPCQHPCHRGGLELGIGGIGRV